jgi:hypothetical protein
MFTHMPDGDSEPSLVGPYLAERAARFRCS